MLVICQPLSYSGNCVYDRKMSSIILKMFVNSIMYVETITLTLYSTSQQP